MRIALVVVFLLACWPGAAVGWTGDQTEPPVPATAEARQSDASVLVLLKTPIERVKPQVITLSQDGRPVKLSIKLAVKGKEDTQLWEYRYEPGAEWGPGTWVVFRDGLGRLREVRIILLGATTSDDHRIASTGTWVRLSPVKDGRRTRLDLFLAGRLVSGGWEVSGSLADLAVSEDDWLWNESRDKIDWGQLLPIARTEDSRIETLQAAIRKALLNIPVAPTTLWLPLAGSRPDGTSATGAPLGHWGLLPGQEGETGRGLGPWGVSHWLTTGVLRGWGAAPVELKELLEPRSTLPGYSQALVQGDLTTDPSFSLDWIRNLGLKVFHTRYPNRPMTNIGADVLSVPYLDSQENTGFAVDDLAPLLHLLAVTKPGRAYLATLSVQNVVKGVASAVTFRPPSVVLPWVGTDGDVRVSVFDGPREVTRDQWLATSGGTQLGARPDHIILVELPLPASVPLPVLPLR